MSFKKKAFISFFVLFTFLIVSSIVLCLSVVSMSQEKMKDSDEAKLKHIPKFLEDLKILAEAKIFAKITFSKNAEPLISEHVVWTGIENEKAVSSTALFKKHPDHLTTEAAYQNLVRDPEFKKFDADWIAQLKNFDHLDLTTYSLIKNQLNRIENLNGMERIGVHSALPLIDFMDLLNQGTIFAIKTAEKGPTEKMLALSHLHHMAQLIISNASLVAQMTAIVALRREFLLSQKWGVTLTQGLSMEMIDRLKRVAWTWPGIVSLSESRLWARTPDSLDSSLQSREIKNYMKAEFMACGAAGEIPFSIMLSEFLEPQWPLEPSYKEVLESSRTQYRTLASICHTEPYLVYLKPMEANFSPLEWKTQNIPYFRRAVAETLMSIAIPSYMRLYDEMDEKRSPTSTTEILEKTKALRN